MKKITVKPILQVFPNAKQKKDIHPLYFLVIYNRNNTKIPAPHNIYLGNVTDAPKELVETEKRIIQDIVKYMVRLHGNDFTFRNFGGCYKLYRQDLISLIESYLKSKLLSYVSIKYPLESKMFQNCEDVPFETYFSSLDKIWELYEFIGTGFQKDMNAYLVNKDLIKDYRLIDWLTEPKIVQNTVINSLLCDIHFLKDEDQWHPY